MTGYIVPEAEQEEDQSLILETPTHTQQEHPKQEPPDKPPVQCSAKEIHSSQHKYERYNELYYISKKGVNICLYHNMIGYIFFGQ